MRIYFILLFVITSSIAISQEMRSDSLFYYKDAVFSGKIKQYYRNPEKTLKSVIKVVDGKLNGKSTFYYDNGNLKEERRYTNSLKTGKWKRYNSDKVLISLARYENNNKHGKWKIWDDSARLRYVLMYKNGQKYGVWKMYDENGKLTDTKIYK